MSTLDIIILVALIPFLIQGVKKGFVSQLAALLSVVIGIWLAFRISTPVCEYLRPYIHVSDSILHAIGFVLILVVVILVLNLIGSAIQKLLKVAMLGWLDKLLGIALALVKGLILLGVIVLLFESLNSSLEIVTEEQLSSSILYGPLRDTVHEVFPYFKELISNQ